MLRAHRKFTTIAAAGTTTTTTAAAASAVQPPVMTVYLGLVRWAHLSFRNVSIKFDRTTVYVLIQTHLSCITIIFLLLFYLVTVRTHINVFKEILST